MAGGPSKPRYAAAAAGDGADDTSATVYVESDQWDSSPFNLESVTDNNLGLMAKSCAEQFCHAGIDGLDLWISFEEVRSPNITIDVGPAVVCI